MHIYCTIQVQTDPTQLPQSILLPLPQKFLPESLADNDLWLLNGGSLPTNSRQLPKSLIKFVKASHFLHKHRSLYTKLKKHCEFTAELLLDHTKPLKCVQFFYWTVCISVVPMFVYLFCTQD